MSRAPAICKCLIWSKGGCRVVLESPTLAMIPAPAQEAFSALSTALLSQPELWDPVRSRWHAKRLPLDPPLPGNLLTAADLLGSTLPKLTQGEAELAALAKLLADPCGEVLFSWCVASTWRRDARLAKLLSVAAAEDRFRDRVVAAARDRVVEGPLLDALACAPLLGDGLDLGLPANTQALARLEILIWEAGASALEAPDLGRWLWGS